ncbi:uncharacterized protein B0P05DRAFT_566685, partial [Gilbertella persicaria]|uniref:uncharacterized protein n=1 Tax=Gilbertella persicaria TaxID=101096 RepID=UPI002220778D
MRLVCFHLKSKFQTSSCCLLVYNKFDMLLHTFNILKTSFFSSKKNALLKELTIYPYKTCTLSGKFMD